MSPRYVWIMLAIGVMALCTAFILSGVFPEISLSMMTAAAVLILCKEMPK